MVFILDGFNVMLEISIIECMCAIFAYVASVIRIVREKRTKNKNNIYLIILWSVTKNTIPISGTL